MTVTAEMPEANVLRVMDELFTLGNADTYNFIAEINGFEGWDNTGIYNKKTQTYKMVVFSYGDTLNK